MTSTMRTVAAVVLVLGGVAYADWVLQLFLPVQADLTTSFISELSAGSQPYHDLFRVADVVGGVLLAVGGAIAWAVVRRRPVIWLSLVVLGVCIVLEATLPLDKTFTFAAVLPRTGTHAWWKRVTEPHGLASLVETTSFVVLFATCTAALRRTTAPERRQRLLAGVGAAAIVCGVADAVLTAALLMGGHAGPLGLVQRVGVTLTAVWLAAAPALLVTGRSDRARHGEAARGREAARPVCR